MGLITSCSATVFVRLWAEKRSWLPGRLLRFQTEAWDSWWQNSISRKLRFSAMYIHHQPPPPMFMSIVCQQHKQRLQSFYNRADSVLMLSVVDVHPLSPKNGHQLIILFAYCIVSRTLGYCTHWRVIIIVFLAEIPTQYQRYKHTDTLQLKKWLSYKKIKKSSNCNKKSLEFQVEFCGANGI